ncbi:hypothetical protein ACIQZO_00930 [Streptomyces sp. NPDC097617]|uniref:hypothetical protein n=1 Tax=Streptomyces sp. NPDC097617 TaxID=3366091 RepID=UPI0037F108CA
MIGLAAATKAVFRYRRPRPWCWEVVVKAVCDETHAGRDADLAVTQAGPAVSAHADRIAVSLGKGLGPVDALTLALAGMGDLRALPGLRRLARERPLSYDRPHARILAALPAAELLPVLLPSLRRKPERHYTSSPMLEPLVAWGTAAAPAVPEVVPYLDTPYPYDALRALGRIGPPAAVAADRMAAYATGRRDVPPGRHIARRAAWAHWRVTGEPTLALDVCGAAVRSGTASHGLPFLADLGPPAAAHADPVRGLMESPGAWTRVAAAHAYWRITGDPEPAVPVLLAEVDPAWAGNPAMPVREAVHRLGEIGAPAAAAASRLRSVLAREERLTHPFVGVRVLADEVYVRTLTVALERIAAGEDGGPVPPPALEPVPAPVPTVRQRLMLRPGRSR